MSSFNLGGKRKQGGGRSYGQQVPVANQLSSLQQGLAWYIETRYPYIMEPSVLYPLFSQKNFVRF